VSHQGLKNWLEMARRQAMSVCKRLGGDWPSPRVQSNVDDGRDSQDAFTRQQLHVKIHAGKPDSRLLGSARPIKDRR
jgi:hypothetical protein